MNSLQYILMILCISTCGHCDPLVLTGDNFQPSIDSGEPYFVKFYAPWCGHCKHLAPTWDKLADQFDGTNVHIAKVDCTVETKLCADRGVKGYPTLKLFSEGHVSDYREARDIDSLINFVTAVGSTRTGDLNGGDTAGSTQLTDSNFNSYITGTPGLHFVKFYAPWCGHCQRLAPMWNDLALHYKEDLSVHISKVDCTEETVTCKMHEIKGYPTLLVFVNGLVVKRYTGNRDLKDLIQFLTDIVAQEAPPVVGVELLTSTTFLDAVRKDGGLFVKFFAPWCGHCKMLAPTWDKLAEEIYGSSSECTIAKVDCTLEQDLCSEQQVHGYPTLVLFQNGERKDYRGPRDLNSLLRFVQENS